MAQSIFLGVFMPILVFSILSYTCYQYIFNFHGFLFRDEFVWNDSNKRPIWRIVIALFLCISSLVSYTSIMLKPSNPLPIKQNDKPKEDPPFDFPNMYVVPLVEEDSSIVVALSMSGPKGEPLYCQTCQTIKPERAHHCRECNRCTAKMDHHCIWINGCVNEDNYKFFFLFIFYVATYSLFVLCTVAPMLYEAIKNEIGDITLEFVWRVYKAHLACIYYLWRNVSLILWHRKWIPLFTGVHGLDLAISLHWYAVTLLGFLFGVMLTGFTVVNFWYIIKNQTSIEHIATRPVYIRADFDKSGANYEVMMMASTKVKHMYDVGWYNNWCSVMGSLWLVPVKGRFGSETVVVNSHEKIYPYNTKFCMKMMEYAKYQRKERLRDIKEL